jgi:hypothetical protein
MNTLAWKATTTLAFTCALAPLSSACADDVAGHSFSYARDEVLQLQHLQSKATHNSFHVAPDDLSIEEWNYTMPKLTEQLDNGVRSVELDVHLEPEVDRFEVYHVKSFDGGTTCLDLADCLAELRAWSDAHPAHQPLFVLLPLRIVFDAAIAEEVLARLERAVLEHWPEERLVTPAAVQGDDATLRDAVTTRGWPTLGAARGRVVFTLQDELETNGAKDAFRTVYTHGGESLEGRKLFVRSPVDAPYAAMVEVGEPNVDAEVIRDAVASNFLVRTLADKVDSTPEARAARLESALASGAHLLATDHPVDTLEVPRFDIPEGKPSRCNPIVAPEACAPTDIEDPSFIDGASLP